MTHARGFTLIEMIMAMVITGILAAMVSVFIAKPVEGYVATARRAELTDMADLAIKRIALEVRGAVPNSIPVAAAATSEFELIPSRTAARYCIDTDTGCDSLSFNAANDQFDLLGQSLAMLSTDQLVVYNTGQIGLNAYDGNNRRAISPNAENSGATVTLNAATAQPVTRLQLAGASFPYDSPGHRVHVVSASGPVMFQCANNELRRYTGYGYDHDESDATSNALLISADVLTCNFTYNATSATNGLLSMTLTLSRDGETITLMHQVHVDNMP